jgi:hypothetical protein
MKSPLDLDHAPPATASNDWTRRALDNGIADDLARLRAEAKRRDRRRRQ